jgi:hypothetical protein
MATKIVQYQNHKEQDSEQYLIHGDDNIKAIRKKYSLLVLSNGNIVCNDIDLATTPINLGNAGDHNVTALSFDTHELL